MSELESSEIPNIVAAAATPTPLAPKAKPEAQGEAEVEGDVKSPQTWTVLSIKSRVDSFSQEELSQAINEARAQGHLKIALDLKTNRFLSFQAIRFCVEVAKELQDLNGAFALISCPQKTKRHFEIYGSLRHIHLVRNEKELESLETGSLGSRTKASDLDLSPVQRILESRG